MYCVRCGAQNDDNAYRCTSCGEVLQRPPGDGGFQPGLGPAAAGAKLTQAIVVTLFCCMPFGVVAIVYAALAMSQNSSGNYARTRICKQIEHVGMGQLRHRVDCHHLLRLYRRRFRIALNPRQSVR